MIAGRTLNRTLQNKLVADGGVDRSHSSMQIPTWFNKVTAGLTVSLWAATAYVLVDTARFQREAKKTQQRIDEVRQMRAELDKKFERDLAAARTK